MTANSISEMLRETSVRLEALRRAEKRFARELAPNFQLFDAFNVDEMTLSRCIGGLLDPFGDHGQGMLFLRAFLKQIDLAIDLNAVESVRVMPEAVIDKNRRLDLLLEIDSYRIGIENKPWAGYQDGQLHDYAEWLEKRARSDTWMLVCLANGEPPESAISRKTREQREATNNFRQMTFSTLADLLENTGRNAAALSVRIYTEHLARYIRSRVNGEPDMTDIQEIESLIDSDPRYIEPAVSIAAAWPEIRQRKLEELRLQLDNRWNQTFRGADSPKFYWSSGMASEAGECWFGFASRDDQAFIPCFAFERAGLSGFYWGVRPRHGTIQPGAESSAEEIHELMNSEFEMDGRSNRYWAWWSYADRPPISKEYSDWLTSPAPWAGIADGSLADRLVKVACRMQRQLGRANCWNG